MSGREGNTTSNSQLLTDSHKNKPPFTNFKIVFRLLGKQYALEILLIVQS